MEAALPFLCSRCGFQIPEIPDRPAPRCPRCWTSLAGASGFPLPEPREGDLGSGRLSPLQAALPALPRDPGPGDRVAGCRLMKEWARRDGVVTFEALEEQRGEGLLLSLNLAAAPAGPELQASMDREAARIGRLEAGGLCPLAAWGIEEGFPYLAHRGEGRGLQSWLDGKRRAARRGRALGDLAGWLGRLADLAEQVDRAHGAGITLGGVDPGGCALRKDGSIASIGLGRGAWGGAQTPAERDVEGLIDLVREIGGLAAADGPSPPDLADLSGGEPLAAAELAETLRRMAHA